MPYGKRNYKKMARKAVRNPRPKKVAKAGALSAKVKKYVKSTIARNIENKHYVKDVFFNTNCPGVGFDSTSTNSGLTTSTSIIPTISPGVAVDQRIGNKIRVRQLQVRMHLQSNPVNPTNNSVEGLPFYVRVVFYNRKDSKTNNTNNAILDLGGSSTSFTGATSSLLYNYNKDTFNIIKSQTFKMQPIQRLTAAGVSSDCQVANGFSSHILRSFNIKCPKVLTYDDVSATPNARIFCAIGVVNADGSGIQPAVGGYRLRVSMDSHLVFEDA